MDGVGKGNAFLGRAPTSHIICSSATVMAWEKDVDPLVEAGAGISSARRVTSAAGLLLRPLNQGFKGHGRFVGARRNRTEVRVCKLSKSEARAVRAVVLARCLDTALQLPCHPCEPGSPHHLGGDLEAEDGIHGQTVVTSEQAGTELPDPERQLGDEALDEEVPALVVVELTTQPGEDGGIHEELLGVSESGHW